MRFHLVSMSCDPLIQNRGLTAIVPSQNRTHIFLLDFKLHIIHNRINIYIKKKLNSFHVMSLSPNPTRCFFFFASLDKLDTPHEVTIDIA